MTEQSPKEFHARHSVSKMTLSRWRNAGHLVVTESGAIDVEATDARLAAAGLGKFRTKPQERTGDLAEQQRRREVALARLRRQEWHRRSAEWVTRPVAEAAWREWAAFTHHHLLRAVPSLMARLAPCSAMAEMPAAIRDVVYDCLRTLAETETDCRFSETGMLPAVGDDASKRAAETIKVGALALLRQLDVDIASGDVINVSGFVHSFGDACSRVRQRMLSLENSLPPRLSATGKTSWQRIVHTAIQDALAEMPIAPEVPGSSLNFDNGVIGAGEDETGRSRVRGKSAHAGEYPSNPGSATGRKRAGADRG